MRLFTAIHLPEEVREHLRLAQERLDRVATEHAVRWTRVNNLHVTLKFLGDVPEARSAELTQRLASVSPMPATVLCDRLLFFPPRGPVRIVAAGLSGDTSQLNQLYIDIERVIEPMGFARDPRRFTPHVTIGRNGGGRHREAIGAVRAQPAAEGWPGPAFIVDSFSLLSSDPRPIGPVYTPIATFPPRKDPEQIL